MLQKKHPFKIARKVSQDEGDVTGLNFQVFSSPDAHSMMADQELDVGNAVKVTLTGFTTSKKLSSHSSCLNGNYFEARRNCLLLATIKSCLEVETDEHGCLFLQNPIHKLPQWHFYEGNVKVASVTPKPYQGYENFKLKGHSSPKW